jgi:PAS domain S-box-containing protein
MGRLDMVPTLLDTVCRITGMGFAAIARVTEDRWIACSVHDVINFGLRPGDELKLETTICHEIRESEKAVVISDVDADPEYAAHHTPAMYGFKSYVSVPIILPDGTFFGTLCAIDPHPRDLTRPEVLGTFQLFSKLLALQLDQADKVTARLIDSAAMRESEARHRQILDSAIDYAIISMDRLGRVTRWNEGAHRIFGWTEDEMLGQTAERFFTPEDRAHDRIDAEMRAARDTGRGSDERWHLHKDGSRFWASGAMMPLKTEAGAVDGYVKVLRDRTDERRRQQRLALLAEISAGLLESDDPNVVLGPILEQSTDLLGFDESYNYVLTPDCEHLHLTHSVGASEEVRATLDNASFDLPICGVVAQTRKSLIIEHLQQTTEPRYEMGRARGYNAFAAFPVMSADKLHGVLSFASRTRSSFDAEALAFFATLARYVAVVRARLDSDLALRDAAERLEQRVEERSEELKHTEQALRQSQKMEAVGQLTGGLAHDFNNLLTGISGALELLTTRISQGRYKEVDRYVEAAQGAAKRAAALTHRLLAFSRQQTLDPKPTDANRLVAGIAELIRRTVGPAIELEVVASGGLWPTLVDPNQLENALLNLCINARDAMPEGGRLTIETANTWIDSRAARERDMLAGQYMAISVSDTGTGMSPQIIAKAFDPFFTTKPLGQGTGLGLSMIYGFARQSGGQVRIYSEVGAGTTMRIYLPRHLGEAEEAEAALDLGDVPRASPGETVLVVDDEPTIRMLVTEVLEELGYAAIEARDGASGLSILRSDARVDLLVTDVGLPGGMNGRQMADMARVRRPDLKVLFITGYAENAVVGNGHLEHGMHVMTKPFAMEALATRIRELITLP